MSGSNCCFLTFIQVSQEVVRWSGIPISLWIFQCVMIHTVRGFSIVNESEVDVFLKFPCFLHDPTSVGNLISVPSDFLKPSLYIWKFSVHVLLKPSLKDFERNLTIMWIECNCMITLSWINYKPLVSSLNGTYRHSILMPTSKLFIHPPREVLGPHNSPSGWWSLNWTGFSLLR